MPLQMQPNIWLTFFMRGHAADSCSVCPPGPPGHFLQGCFLAISVPGLHCCTELLYLRYRALCLPLNIMSPFLQPVKIPQAYSITITPPNRSCLCNCWDCIFPLLWIIKKVVEQYWSQYRSLRKTNSYPFNLLSWILYHWVPPIQPCSFCTHFIIQLCFTDFCVRRQLCQTPCKSPR